MSIVNSCQGCGVLLQTIEPTKVGFQEKSGQIYCQSCYKLKHYGLVETHLHPDDLPQLNPEALMVMVSSVLHLDLLFSYPIYRYQSNATYVYLINQIDLLPDSTNLDLLLENIIRKAKTENIPYKDIILMSAKNKLDIKNLHQYLSAFKHKEIYLLGVQNSGKTTLFKALTHDKHALALKKAGLTQHALSKPFGNKTLYDLPGIYQKGYIHQLLNYEVYKNLIPDEKIKPKIFQMLEHQTICLEGLFAITLLKMDSQSFVFYVSKHMRFHKTNDLKVNELFDSASNFFSVHVTDYEEKTFKVPEGKFQITFADIGFMHVLGPCHIKVKHPKSLHLSLTQALFL